MRPSCALLIFLLVGVAGLFGVWQFSPALAALATMFGGLIFLTLNLEIGFFVLLCTGFFLGLQIDFGVYSWAKTIPLLAQLNAPVVEFTAFACLAALMVAWIFRIQPFSTHLLVKKMWGLRFYGLFLLIALVSALTVFDGITGQSVRYLLRTMVFAYAAFFWLPLLFIRERATLQWVVKLWAWIGIGIALFGFSSLVMTAQGEIIRLVPYNIFGIAPLQYNHNLLAEPLVALLPLVAALAFRREEKHQKFFFVGAWIMGAAALLTLSRAAWLAMLIQATVGVWLIWRGRAGQVAGIVARRVGIVVIILLPMLAYMAYFLQTSIVSSSTSARYAASEVSWFYFLREPILGYGPGSYQKLVGDTYAYTLDFGDPLEAHGFIQKILVEEGVLGFLFFAFFLIAIVFFLFEKQAQAAEEDRPLAIAFLLMAVGMMVFELFNTSYFQSVMWLPLGVAVAGSMLLKRNSSLS